MIPLTKRQRDVVELVRDGLTYVEIGHKLGIASETVRVHVSDVAQKGGARPREALRWVITHATKLLAA